MITFKELVEANTPEELEAAKAKHSAEVAKKTRTLTRQQNNAKQIERIDTTGFNKKRKTEVKSYSDMFADQIASTSHKLKRHTQALDAIKRIQTPTKQDTKARKTADKERLTKLGRNTSVLSSFKRLFGG